MLYLLLQLTLDFFLLKLQVWSGILKFPVPYSSKLFWVISSLFAVLNYDFTYSIYNWTKQPSLS